MKLPLTNDLVVGIGVTCKSTYRFGSVLLEVNVGGNQRSNQLGFAPLMSLYLCRRYGLEVRTWTWTFGLSIFSRSETVLSLFPSCRDLW